MTSTSRDTLRTFDSAAWSDGGAVPAAPGQALAIGRAVPHKVLHTITGLNVGGAEHMLVRFLGQLDPAQYASSVLSLLPPGRLAAAASQRAEVASVGMGTLPLPHHLLRLRAQVRSARPDLLHGWMHHGNLAAMLGVLSGAAHAPVIWGVHHSITRLGDEKALTRGILRLSAKLSSRTAAICYCSRVAADDHERIGFDADRRVVIPNGTDCVVFAPSGDAGARLRQMIGIAAERIVIGHVARFHPMKDQIALVRAAARLIAERRDVQVVFIGEGHRDGPVRQQARALGIDARVSTLGVRDDVATLLPGFDVFALSSAWGEAFPLSVGEAMACGVPVVATAVGDCRWLVGPAGAVVPPSDPEALVTALRDLVDLPPATRRSLGRRARERIVDEFSLPVYANRHLELYERALDAHRRHGAARPNPLHHGETA